MMDRVKGVEQAVRASINRTAGGRRFITSALLLAMALCPACRKTPAVSPARAKAGVAVDRATPGFWIWHRSSALTDAEEQALTQAGTGSRPRLYREIVEFGLKKSEWTPRPFFTGTTPELSAGMIPVVRLDPGAETLERPDLPEMLARWLRYTFPAGIPGGTLQLDYDCPVRLLPRYAAVLKELKAAPDLGLREISITALASWIEANQFRMLAEAADEVVPMFYDLAADPPAEAKAGNFQPMAGPETQRWISRWKNCPTSWRAGLPNFERLTLFEAGGTLVGHLREWHPEDLETRSLQSLPAAKGGLAWQVQTDRGIRGTAIAKDQLLVWRAPDDAILREEIQAAFASGASGIVWFALPGPGLRARHTPAHLSALQNGGTPLPRLRAWIDGAGSVHLRNDGPGDLSFAGGSGRLLTLTATTPGSFADRGPGDFFRITGDPDTGLPPSRSVKTVLSFTELQGGAELASESGLIPSGEGRDLRWSADGQADAALPLLR